MTGYLDRFILCPHKIFSKSCACLVFVQLFLQRKNLVKVNRKLLDDDYVWNFAHENVIEIWSIFWTSSLNGTLWN